MLQGCVLTGLVGGAVAPKIPDIDVQIGKENSKEENLVKVEGVDVSTKQEADSINNTTTVPWWALIITAICGILVDPLRIYKEWREVKNG
jgi:hypothetical protein